MAALRTGVLVALMATACSSSYVPAQSPRIATVWRGGYPSYYRDGVEYPSGLFLDGVGDAVKGNPRAEEEASTAHGLMIGGFVCELAGIGMLGGAVGVAASDQHNADDAAVIGLLIGGVVASLAGAIVTANAFPHAYDAINIYNDSVGTNTTPARPAPSPGQAPPFSALPPPPPGPPPPPPAQRPPSPAPPPTAGAPQPPSQAYPPMQAAPPSAPPPSPPTR